MNESGTMRPTKVAIPSAEPMVNAPTTTGSPAACTVPKAASRMIRINGNARRSARSASAVLVRRRSAFSAGSPVHRMVIVESLQRRPTASVTARRARMTSSPAPASGPSTASMSAPFRPASRLSRLSRK